MGLTVSVSDCDWVAANLLVQKITQAFGDILSTTSGHEGLDLATDDLADRSVAQHLLDLQDRRRDSSLQTNQSR